MFCRVPHSRKHCHIAQRVSRGAISDGYQIGQHYHGANFKAAVQQLLDEDVTEENPACACHTFSLVVKNAIDPCKKRLLYYYSVLQLESIWYVTCLGS